MATTNPPIPSNEGLDPMQELLQWKRWRDSVDPNNLTDAQIQYYRGPSPRPNDPQFANPMFSPEATNTYVNAKTHFDLNSGKVTKNKGFMDLPESKWIIAAAAGLAAPYVIPALAGLGAASGGAAAIPTTMGVESATALGLPVTAGLGSAGTAAAAGGGALSTLGKATGLLTKGKSALTDVLGAAGSGVGEATNAAANNRLTSAELAQRVQSGNTSAQSAYESELMNRAREEDTQRKSALKNLYAASYAKNRTAGPNNTAGLTQYSPEYLTALDQLASQGGTKLGKTAQYDTDTMGELKPTAVDVDEFMKKYGQPSTMEKVGNWLSPTLSTLGKVAKYF